MVVLAAHSQSRAVRRRADRPVRRAQAAPATTYVLGARTRSRFTRWICPTSPTSRSASIRAATSGCRWSDAVHAAGMTIEQLETELRDRLEVHPQRTGRHRYRAPSSTASPCPWSGAVGSPGVRQLDGSKTLIEILSISGGPSTDAGPVVRISRRLDQGRIPLPEAVDGCRNRVQHRSISRSSRLLDTNTPEKNIADSPERHHLGAEGGGRLRHRRGRPRRPGAGDARQVRLGRWKRFPRRAES